MAWGLCLWGSCFPTQAALGWGIRLLWGLMIRSQQPTVLRFRLTMTGSGRLHVAVGGVEEFFFGFDVDEDFRNPLHVGEDAVFDDVRDGVAVADGDVSADDDMEVNVVAKADFADKAFFESDDAGDEDGYLADMLLDLRRRCGVEDFGEGRLELTPGAEKDDRRSKEGGPVVHTRVLCNEGERDTDECKQGSDGVAQVMPGVDADSGALNILSD